MTQLVKCLMCKHDKLSLIPRTQVQSCTSVISALKEGMGEPLGLPGLMMSSSFSERPFSNIR